MSAVHKISAPMGDVKLEWTAYVKELIPSPIIGGAPILRLLISGTALDSAASVQDSIPLLGDRMTPEFLETMCLQAKAGMVYLIENHSATLRMGVSVDAEILDEPDGNQSLYVDFELFTKNPAVPFFIEDMQNGYVPQCSVGVFAARVVVFDELAGGYVGLMTEGRIEHVALTRPDHAAYPPAKVEAVFAAGKVRDAIGAALKSLPRIPTWKLQRLEKQRKTATHKGARAPQPRGNTMPKDTGPANGLRMKDLQGKVILKSAEDAVTKEDEAKKEAEAEAAGKEAAIPPAPAMKEAAEAEMCKECGKAMGECKCKEAEAKKEDEAAAAAPEGEGEPDANAVEPAIIETLGNHLAAMKDMLATGSDPKDFMEYAQGDLLPDLEKICTALGGDPDGEEGKEDATKEDEAKAPAPPAPPPAAAPAADEKKDPPAPPAAAPAAPPAKAEPPAPPPAKKEDEDEAKAPMAVKSARTLTEKQKTAIAALKSRKPEDSATARAMEKLLTKVDELTKSNTEISERLKRLDSDEPATSRARRFDGGNGTGKVESDEDVLEVIRGIKDPVLREEFAKSVVRAQIQKNASRPA